MTKGKEISNGRGAYKITISDIFDVERKDEETRLYRDILEFFLPCIEKSILYENKGDEKQKKWDTSFRINDLISWLLEKNHELKTKYAGSKENMSNRVHSNLPRIRTRIEMLIELGLLIEYEEKVPSRRNPKLWTELYDITSNGILITLTLYFTKYVEGSKDHKKVMKFLLDEWLFFLPAEYNNFHNHYYAYLKDILNECIENYYNIPQYFIDLIQDYSHGFSINFADLRRKMNYRIYQKLMSDNQFKSFFYGVINNHDFFKGLGLEDSELFEDSKKIISEILRKVKFQLKLDIEHQIEREFFYSLRSNSSANQEIQWMKRNNMMNATEEELSNPDIENEILQEIVLNFEIKSKWETQRNANLSKFNVISSLVKCNNCSQIYPLPIEIENENLNQIECPHCKNNTMEFYNFELEMNKLSRNRYLKRY